MVDNYDNVCSICSEASIDPAYFICDACREKVKRQQDSESVVSKVVNENQKESEVKNENVQL